MGNLTKGASCGRSPRPGGVGKNSSNRGPCLNKEICQPHGDKILLIQSVTHKEAVHNPRPFRFPQPQLYQQQPQQQPSYGFSLPQCLPPRGRNMQPGPSNEEIPQWAQALALAVSVLHQEVKELKAIITRGHTPLAPAEARLPEGLTFPLQNKEAVDEMDMFLSEEQNTQRVVNYLRRVEGSDLGQLLYDMMAHVMGQAVAETHRMGGMHGKNKFACLRLKEVIFRAVRANKATQGAIDQEMGTIIAKWLRQAPDRQGGRKRREGLDAALGDAAPIDLE